MVLPPEKLPRDPDQLIEIVLDLRGEVETLRATVATLKTMIFGPRSERNALILAEQLSLGLDGDETNAAMPAPANDGSAAVQHAQMRKVRRKAHRNIGALPEHLPRVEQTIEPETTVLRRPPSPHRRDRQRNPGPGCGGAARVAHDPAEIRLSRL
jgi:hypothetical protein